MNIDLARRFIDAVLRRDYDAASACFHPDVTTKWPRGTLHGAAASRRALEQATGGYEQIDVGISAPEFQRADDEIVVRTHEVGRWRDSGEAAFEGNFVFRLTIEGGAITRLILMPEFPKRD